MEKPFILNFLRKNLVINALLIFLINNIEAQVSGTVFRDFNGDGTLQTPSATYEEPGISSITVKAYNSANTLLATTTTSATGTYSFSGLTFPVRIEFTGFPTGFYSSKVGTHNASSIQFYSASTTSANFAVNLPSEYNSGSDKIAGIQMEDASASTLNAIFTVPFGNTGNTSTGRVDLSSPINPSSGFKVGAVWGLAYQPTTDRVFTSAFMRRFAAFGTNGTGAIYVTTNAKNNPASSATSLFINLNGMTVNNAAGGTTTINTGTDPHYYTDLQLDIDNANGSPFDAVGKISFGDMDISDDKKYLYVVSLNDKKLYRIEIDADNNSATNPSSADVLAYNLPAVSCTNGTARPFALGIRNNEVYLGVICDAGNINSTAPTPNLTATVYKLSGTTFSSLISFPMNYIRGSIAFNVGSGIDNHIFRPWVSTWTKDFPILTTNGMQRSGFPQPMLTDIIFDIDGSMILGIGDRFSYQAGNAVVNAINNQYLLLDCRSGGDILRVCNTGTLNSPTYVLEGGTGCAKNPQLETIQHFWLGETAEQEFYVGDNYDEGSHPGHSEVAFGSLTMSYGSKKVVTTALNPIDTDNGGGIFRNGFKYLSNVNGGDLNGYDISGTFGKCNGIGDLEMLGSIAPIEIGNRVFMDTDEDGIQDAGEMGIASVTVKLFKAGVEVASTTTDANGQYIFSNVLPNTVYEIRILAANIPSGKQLTLTNTGNGTVGTPEDMRDSDGSLVSSNAVISYTTGSAGQNDHTLDFGFKTACTFSTTISGTTTICLGQSTTLTTSGGGVYLWSTGSTNSSINVSPTVTTTYSVTVTNIVGCIAITSITVTINTPSASIIGNSFACSGQGTTLTASGGVTYLWSTGSTNTSISVSPTVATTYSVTATTASGCTATSSTIVTINSILPTVSITSAPTTCNNYTLTANRGLGNAVEFTNSANKVDCGNSSSVQITGTSLTLEALVYPKSWRTNSWEGSIINKESFDTKGYILRAGNNGTISFNLGNGTVWDELLTSSLTLSLNTWQHIAATYDGATMKIYLNGNLVASKSSTISFANAGPNLIIGNWGPSTDRGFPGIIDEVRIWNIVRTQAQINADKYRSISPTSSGLRAYYKLDEGTGSTTADATGLGTSGSFTTSPAPVWASPTGTPLNPVTYLWSNGATTSSITAAQSGTYAVTVTNSYGCTASANTSVTVTPTTVINGTNIICNGQSTTLTASSGTAYIWSTSATTSFINVSPTVTTTYSVTVTNVSGCTNIASITVTVNSTPLARVIGLIALCSSTSLSASGGGTYLWSNGATSSSIDVNPTVTTTYYVTVTNSSGCSAVANIAAPPNWVPTVTITGTNIVCSGQSATLTASGGGTYSWSTSATSASISVSPTVTTTYSVTVINSVGCIAAANYTVSVTAAPTAGIGSSITVCKTEYGTNNTILSSLITGASSGSGSWSVVSYPAGLSLANVNGKLSAGVWSRTGFPKGTYVFRYTITGTPPCPNDSEDVTIIINTCCQAQFCVPMLYKRN